MVAAIAEAVIGPKPGTLINRRAVSSFCASFAMMRSSFAIGGVRANSRAVQAVLASAHEQSVPIFQRSPEVIRLVVMMYVRYPLSLRNVEDLLAERGIDISHETVRFWWNRFGPMFAAEIRKRRVAHMRGYPQWRWHLDEVFVKVNGKLCYLWRAVDHEGEVLEAVATAKRDKAAALKLLKRIMKKYGLLAASSPMGFGHIRRR